MTATWLSVMICVSLAGEAASPQLLPKTPGDWRFERIEFPLPFAPGLKHKGFEELGFAPGMFNTKSDTYFTYVFAFALYDDVSIDAAFLKKFLETYYRGLCKAVAEGTDFVIDPSKIVAEVREDHYESPAARHFTVTLHSYDPFVTGKPLTLHLELLTHSSDVGGQTSQSSSDRNRRGADDREPAQVKRVEHHIFAVVSPQSLDAPVWTMLRALKREYRSAQVSRKKPFSP